MKILVGGLCAVLLASVMYSQTANAAAASCESLSSLKLPNATDYVGPDGRGRRVHANGRRRRAGRGAALRAGIQESARVLPRRRHAHSVGGLGHQD